MKLKYQALNAGILVAVLALSVAPVYAGGNQVAYTFTIIDHIFQFSGGGVLYADGTAHGGAIVVCCFGDNENIILVHPTSWDLVPESPGTPCPCVLIHGESRLLRGSMPPLGEFPVPITGTPVRIDFDGDGVADFLIRVTPAN